MNRQSGYTAVSMGLAITLIVTLFSLSGLFQLPNGILYDAFCRITPPEANLFDDLVIVEVSRDQKHGRAGMWPKLLHQLQTDGAKQVIFTFFPSNASDKFYQTAAEMGNVIFGSLVENSTADSSPPLFDPVSPRPGNSAVVTAPYALPPDGYRVHRFERAYFKLTRERDDSSTPSFTVKTPLNSPNQNSGETKDNPMVPGMVTLGAAMAETGKYAPGNGTGVDPVFAINFTIVDELLPVVDLERIVSGGAVPELVNGKSVIIGLESPLDSPGFQTPLHSGPDTLSLAEYSAYGLFTLANHLFVAWATPLARGFIIVSMVVAAMVVYFFLSGMLLWLSAGLIFAASFLGSWVLLRYFFYWPPLFELLIAQLTVLSFLFVRKFTAKDRVAKELILNRSVQLKERFMPTGFFASEEYWSRVINMIHQTLNLERTIFLEKVPRDHRVREIIALNTSIDDIKERRRDYERTPYATAVEKNRAIQISSYFKTAGKGDEEYMVPLIFSGEILGFWAFVVSSSQKTNLATLLPAVKSFAGEIAEILHKRQQWLLEQKRSLSLSGRLLRLDPKEDVYDSVNHTLSLLGRRLSALDLVFNALDASIVLYNIFGQVTHVNQSMAEILKRMKIAVFKMSALDLAVKLTDHTMEEMRGILSQTIINHETATLHVTLADAKRSYLLSLRPLVGKEENFGRDEAYPFNLQGILFEMIDITDIRDFSRLKSELFEKSNAHLKESVESMGNVCMLLEDDDLISDEKSALITEMESRKSNIQKFMDELNSYMEKDNFSNDYHIFPVSAGKLLNEAAGDLEEKAWTRKVTITIAPSPLSDLVMAAPADVKDLCIALLTVLVEDAYDNTAISVALTPSDSHYTFTMTNSGYGMPNEDFQRYLTSSTLTDSKAFTKIHQILPRLGIWQADLTGSSEVGQGIEFKLRLMRFQ